MGKSLILGVDELVENQAQAFQTVNDGLAAHEQSNNKLLTKTVVANAAQTLTELEFTRNSIILVTGHTAAINLTVPNVVNTVPVNRRFSVINGGTGDVTVRTATPAATVIVAAGAARSLHADSNTIRDVGGGGGGGSGSASFSLGVFNPGLAAADAELLRYVFVDNVSFTDNFGGSRGSIRVNPTSAITFAVFKNTTAIGTVAISTSGVFTFDTTGTTNETFAIGDRLIVRTPVTQDPTAADIAFNFKGTRT